MLTFCKLILKWNDGNKTSTKVVVLVRIIIGNQLIAQRHTFYIPIPLEYWNYKRRYHISMWDFLDNFENTVDEIRRNMTHLNKI